MMKTWQELPNTSENKVATAAFRNIVIEPSLCQGCQIFIGKTYQNG
jgi:hypothetical protein